MRKSSNSNHARPVALGAAAVFLSLVLAGCAGAGTDGPTASSAATGSSPVSTAASPSESAGTTATPLAPMSSDAVPDYMVIGEATAPIEIRVFSDYLCPHCATFAAQVEPRIISEFVDSGAAKLVLSDFVVVDQRASTLLAIAARAAGEQGMYAEFHATAMNMQEAIRAGGVLDEDVLAAIATEAGIPDIEAFAAALTSPELRDGVDASIADGQELSVRGTPTVLVNGVAVSEPTFEAIKAAVDAVN